MPFQPPLLDNILNWIYGLHTKTESHHLFHRNENELTRLLSF